MADEKTLEERVEALENTARYKLRYSGEQVENFFDLLAERGFECGREEVTITGKAIYRSVTLSVSSPTKKTQVIATVRMNDSPSPYDNICTVLNYVSGVITATLCMGPNVSGSSVSGAYLPTGTYYIDWLVIGRGES